MLILTLVLCFFFGAVNTVSGSVIASDPEKGQSDWSWYYTGLGVYVSGMMAMMYAVRELHILFQ